VKKVEKNENSQKIENYRKKAKELSEHEKFNL